MREWGSGSERRGRAGGESLEGKEWREWMVGLIFCLVEAFPG